MNSSGEVRIKMFANGEVSSYKRIIMKGGYVDLRCGIQMLSTILTVLYRQNLNEYGVLYLFCGRSAKKVKGLLCQPEGTMLITLQLYTQQVKWVRNTDALFEITNDQLQQILHGEAIQISLQED